MDRKCKEMVSLHLRNCPACMEKYSIVKKLFDEAERRRKLIKDRENMQEEISAYLDGEMDKKELLRFEKKLSTNKEYEEALISTTKLKRILNNSFYKMKYNLEKDASLKFHKKVMERYKNSGFKTRVKSFLNRFWNQFFD